MYLQRPYHAGYKKGEIVSGIYINLHTKNSISFTKGIILKKHLVTNDIQRTQEKDDEPGNDHEQIDFDEEKKGARLSQRSPNPKSKRRLVVEYVV